MRKVSKWSCLGLFSINRKRVTLVPTERRRGLWWRKYEAFYTTIQSGAWISDKLWCVPQMGLSEWLEKGDSLHKQRARGQLSESAHQL